MNVGRRNQDIRKRTVSDTSSAQAVSLLSFTKITEILLSGGQAGRGWVYPVRLQKRTEQKQNV